MADSQEELDLVQIGKAIVALMAADRDDRSRPGPMAASSDAILAEAGFTARQIASLTGQNYEAVRSALRRRQSKEKATSPAAKPDPA